MTQSTEAPSSMSRADAPRKHCWECLRRRLVCDSARPVCNRCCNNGIVCSGYGEKQPLRWVKPGRVTARNRRRPKAGGVDKLKDDAVVVWQSSSTTRNDGEGELQSKFSSLSISGATQSKALDTILRFEITCENFAAMQASYTCKFYL
ncbi:hypothetical protein HD806DRAFT_533169 [Xylariaceae sp. AK1471]|nr:hypothetical protein HD806DRAFT_533169 [Xylariaceae sp. AK1471]